MGGQHRRFVVLDALTKQTAAPLLAAIGDALSAGEEALEATQLFAALVLGYQHSPKLFVQLVPTLTRVLDDILDASASDYTHFPPLCVPRYPCLLTPGMCALCVVTSSDKWHLSRGDSAGPGLHRCHPGGAPRQLCGCLYQRLGATAQA